MKVNTGKLLFSLLGLLGLFLGTVGATTIVEFNFNESAKTSAINRGNFNTKNYTGDDGIVWNIGISIISLSWGKFSNWVGWAALSNTWSYGSDKNYWMINFKTSWYGNLKLYSKQQSSGRWPRDFKVQYNTWWILWNDIPNSNITVANNLTGWVLTWSALPSELNNNSNIFLRWIMTSNTSVNGSTVANSGTQRIDDIIVEGTAFFTATYSTGANGALSGSTLQTVNSWSMSTSVQAIPNTGYSFSGWSDGSIANPRTDLITGNLSVTAEFAIITNTVNYTAGANGTISGSGTQTINYGADASEVIAVANTGYSFSGWSDGSVANPRTDMNVTWAISVTGNFVVNQYVLTFDTDGGTPVATITGNYNSSVTAPANPTKTGYTFSGWDTPIPSTIPAMNTS